MTKPKKSLIYCRVSSKSQLEGSGLESQEHRCRVFAAERQLEVERVFPDDVSGQGDFMKRKGMVALLEYLELNSDTDYVVIFDDLKRLARDTLTHLTLRTSLKRFNATPLCLNFKFDETPEGQFIETLFAAQGQLEAQQGGRQTVQKMKARMEQGYYVFPIVNGYRYTKGEGGGRVIVRDEPSASIVAEALNGYASGRFQTKAEVRRFLESFPEYPKNQNGKVHDSRVHELLTRVVYCGYIEYEPWGVSRRKAKHEGLISYETYMRIQQRLEEGANVPARKNLSVDFPLRGFVNCSCNAPMTACWSKGRAARYPYYLCQNKECEHKGKSIRRDVMESEFEELLKSLSPSAHVIGAASKIFRKIWEHLVDCASSRKQSLEMKLSAKDREIQKLLDLVVEASIPDVVSAYEQKIKLCKDEQVVIREKIANCGTPLKTFDESYRTAMQFLANPLILWNSERYEHKRAVLKMVFSERLVYVRGKGYRTARNTIPFAALQVVEKGRKKMAPRAGLEPATQ